MRKLRPTRVNYDWVEGGCPRVAGCSGPCEAGPPHRSTPPFHKPHQVEFRVAARGVSQQGHLKIKSPAQFSDHEVNPHALGYRNPTLEDAQLLFFEASALAGETSIGSTQNERKQIKEISHFSASSSQQLSEEDKASIVLCIPSFLLPLSPAHSSCSADKDQNPEPNRQEPTPRQHTV